MSRAGFSCCYLENHSSTDLPALLSKGCWMSADHTVLLCEPTTAHSVGVCHSKANNTQVCCQSHFRALLQGAQKSYISKKRLI